MNEFSPIKFSPIKFPADYEDVLSAPPHMVAEIIHGGLHLQPRPAPRHARAISSIGGNIHPPFDLGRSGGPGGWWILDEPELHLGKDILVPDIAGWRRERMPSLPETAYFTLAPDWVCEVLSPSTRNLDLTDKRAIYGEHGVSYLWFVDPLAQTLEAFRLTDDGWLLIASLKNDETVKIPPFDAISFSLADLWP